MAKPKYYNTHARRTTDPQTIPKAKIERGMMLEIRYKPIDRPSKKYIVFVLSPDWKGKLHGLSLENFNPAKIEELSKVYKERMARSVRVKLLEIPKLTIDTKSQRFYLKEIKDKDSFYYAYRTFNLGSILSVFAVNYDYGPYDLVPPKSERRRQDAEDRALLEKRLQERANKKNK